MGSKRVLPLNIWEIVRRFPTWANRSTVLLTALSYDRETVRAYVRLNEFKTPHLDATCVWSRGLTEGGD